VLIVVDGFKLLVLLLCRRRVTELCLGSCGGQRAVVCRLLGVYKKHKKLVGFEA